MVAGTIGELPRSPVEREGASEGDGRLAPVHHVVARFGDEGLEVLRAPAGGRGETLAVFSAGWAARGYLFAEALGGEWHAKACGPDELISLLAGPCASTEWVALDPRPDPRGEAVNVMPRENFLDYLSSSRAPSWPRGNGSDTTGGDPRWRGNYP